MAFSTANFRLEPVTPMELQETGPFRLAAPKPTVQRKFSTA